MGRFIALLLLLAAGAPVDIRLETAGGHPFFKVAGPDLQADRFAVYVDAVRGAPAILGSSRIDGGVLIFEPRFPLQPGLRYRAVYGTTSATFEIPKGDLTPTTVVEQVYPSTSRLPENQLKFYIHFSAPMSRGEAYRRMRLLDESGRPVQLPFLELDEELWDRDGKRLTIFFDPGRVKRGLLPREEVGPPIEAGKRYTLVIDRDWRDAEGKLLRTGFQKSFQVGPPDHDPPDPRTWKLQAPGAGTSDPLSVEFPKPMDHALLLGLLDVTDPRGNSIPGSVQVEREETRWLFTPRDPWPAGQYFVVAGTTLEDLAGNTLNRPFEVDVFERVQERIARETTRLPFTIR